MPVLLYGLQSIPLSKQFTKSLEYTFNRLMVKFFKTNNARIISECQKYSAVKLPRELLTRRHLKFLVSYNSTENCLCQYFSN